MPLKKPFLYFLRKRNEDGRSGDKINSPIEPAIFNNSSQDSITDDMIFSVSEDKAGNLWFATRRHGACRYDGKSFTSFKENEGFVSYGIYSIIEDKKGNMWFSTEKNGVFCYDGKSFKNYTTADGLVYNSVFSILEDKNGNLWFGTRGFGLSRYDGKTFVNFSE
jgi:ligand-binding sensor domain-containing protein